MFEYPGRTNTPVCPVKRNNCMSALEKDTHEFITVRTQTIIQRQLENKHYNMPSSNSSTFCEYLFILYQKMATHDSYNTMSLCRMHSNSEVFFASFWLILFNKRQQNILRCRSQTKGGHMYPSPSNR